MRRVCDVAQLELGVARGFGDVVAIRLADCLKVYRNACPHLGVPLDWLPGKFMSADGAMLVCATHGAEFRPSDGFCVRGPCRGDSLTAVPCEIRDGAVYVFSV